MGRTDAGGIRGTIVASTNAGDLHVKAVPHDDWRLSSRSGTTCDDLHKLTVGVRQLYHEANGRGKRIEMRTASGRILVI